MNYLLDTCTVSDFFKKDPHTLRHFQSLSPKQLYISSVTIMEIEYGLTLHQEKEKKIRPIWESLLEVIVTLPFCSECAKKSAALRATLKNSGRLIGPYDILLSGTALAHNLTVVTSNTKEFSRTPEITVEDWRQPHLVP